MRLPLILHKLGSPRFFYELSGRLMPWTDALFLTLAAAGLYVGLLLAPTHSEQGESYRIIYIHVPAASLSLTVYAVMAGAGLIYLVWRMKMADHVAAASAPIGAALTFLALVTGSIWGKPTWGTWWQWDARLTSELILLFLYLGYMALRAAIEDAQNAARASAVLALVGVVNIPIIKYSVEWWNTLHQGATISKLSSPTIEATMLAALLLMMAAMFLLFVSTMMGRARCRVLHQEARSAWVAQLPDERRSRLPLVLPAVALAGAALHWTLSEREVVMAPSEVLRASPGGNILVQGTVRSVEAEGPPARFSLGDGSEQITVLFQGTLPRYFRLDWGARVEGRWDADGAVLEARSVAALNVRDHRRYVVTAYLIALVVVGLSYLSPVQCMRQARAMTARRLRRERLAT